ncbi:hypothetical protein [Amorphus coralli]|uniref:hypothetical protein n=1 Tax=Amorphus coralli TaxID=340680 RepID=UPI00036DEB2E|nr:hypothetical protein [Amorphus coralli]
MAWRQLSMNEAEAHPLYGVKGWLLVFLALFALGGVVAVLELVLPEPAGYASLFGYFDRQVAWVDAVPALMLFGTAMLGFARAPLFGSLIVPMVMLRFLGFALAASTFAFEALTVEGARRLARQEVLVGGIVMMVAIYAVFCALLCWYFIASKRVNVTYRHRVADHGEPAPTDTIWDPLLDEKVGPRDGGA